MKRPALLVGCLALCLLLPAAGVRAQAVVPEVPTIGTVSSGDDSLTIPWSAPPSDGGSPITSYDLRYILSDAESKADDDWTLKEGIWSAGALSHVLTGLTKDTSYDLRVRAVNVNGAGDWSDVSTQATNDHGDSRASATAIAVDASVAGRIDPGGDKDYFTITVSESTDLWVYTTGPTDTRGELTDDIGGTLASNDDRSVPGSTLNFSLRAIIPAGTYYIEVEGYRDTMGPYTLHVRAAAIPETPLRTLRKWRWEPPRLAAQQTAGRITTSHSNLTKSPKYGSIRPDNWTRWSLSIPGILICKDGSICTPMMMGTLPAIIVAH